LPYTGLGKTIASINAQYCANTNWALEVDKDSVGKFVNTDMAKRTGVYYHPTSPDNKAISNKMAEVFKARGANKTN